MHKKPLKLLSLWLPPLLWALMIFTFSSGPTGTASPVAWQDFAVKKFTHVVLYATLSVLLYRAFKGSGVKSLEAALWAITLSVLYGFSDEFHQQFTPTRTPKLRDVGFDTIGASTAIFLIWKLLPKAPKKLRDLAIKLDLI